MSTDVKEMTDTVQEVAFGAVETASQVAQDPIGAVRRQVKGLEKRGTPTARKVNRRINSRIENASAPARDAFKTITKTAERVAGELDPEKVAIRGLRLVKVQAKRDDMVGDVAKQTLGFFNRSFKTVARVAGKLETASELAPRTSTQSSATRRPATRTRTRRSRSAA
jgi:hypothetical protein